jgi:uncharacterized protein (DUF2252 family)
MNVVKATRHFEDWLSHRTHLVQKDVHLKHVSMAAGVFPFLRATYYRWAQLWPKVCSDLAKAPRVLAVGDLHVENFGTWRDPEGRLIWGINDFDEACLLPYTNDLVRLATSAWLAIELEHLATDSATACAAIQDGYLDGLNNGGRPFVLSERNRWLRDTVTGRLRDPTLFWKKLTALPKVKAVPATVTSLLKQAMPEAGLDFRVLHRQAGLGSLGRPRFTAIAEWRGGKIAREAKALLPSAWLWAAGAADASRIYYGDVVRCAVRAADPFLQIRNAWILRRLAPYCSRIELSQLPRQRDEERLLWAMGYELANVHLGTRQAATRVRSDLRRRKTRWLRECAEIMAEATVKDWKAWRKQ